MLSLVGWQQHYNPAYRIDADLTESESGLTYQGAHPLVTLDNVRSIMPVDWESQYPEWVATATYAKGAKVAHGSKFWRAKDAIGAGVEPRSGSASWEEFAPLSDYVREITVAGINATVQRFLTEKQLARETRTILDRRTLFDGAARLQSVITPHDNVVGFEIVPARAMGVTTAIHRIGLQMLGSGTVTLYVFHSSRREAIKSVTLELTGRSGGFQWFALEEPIYLPYMGGDTDAGGSWYIVYDQAQIPTGVRALNVAKDWSAEPCSTCDARYAEDWKQITKYMLVSPFQTSWAGDGGLDPAALAYTRTVNYGLNLEVSVGCDLTGFIIEQRGIFATALQKQVAASVLRTIAMNPDVRVNRNQLNVTREEIMYALDGNPQGRATGLASELDRAFKALSIDTQGLDRICLQCNNHGVKYRTV